ncbi:MAG: hypothetical protein AAGH40_01490 [Verrucomicrobiota bacterium]
MHTLIAVFKTITLLILSALIAIAALLIPAHLRSVDMAVIKLAGTKGDSSSAKAEEALDSAFVGPAKLISQSTVTDKGDLDRIISRTSQLLAKNPGYAISGGPDPYFEDFLRLVQVEAEIAERKNAVLSVLLPRTERASLFELLSDSNNANVQSVLLVRNLPGLVRLHPADHPAGAPYDAGVLTLALLIEGRHFKPGLARRIGNLASQADLGTPAAVVAIENLVISTLTLGRQLDYQSLASLAAIATNTQDWAKMAALFRTRTDQTPLLFTTLLFSQSADKVYNYFTDHSDTAQVDIEAAVKAGPKAIKHLLNSDKIIFRPNALTKWYMAILSEYRPSFYAEITLANRSSALLLKLIFLCVSGLFFALAAGAAWRSSQAEGITISRFNPAIVARDSLISLVFALTIWTLFEPEILQSSETLPDTGPRIEFVVADAIESLQSPVRIMQELNTVTLLVLALFFIIQLVIYTFSLIKLREISKQSLHPNMKLRLLDNEENLFDCGLYVGLGGTVLSLILVAVGVVEASLMAAYASTLFGIIFVALLKILHLRPYRKKLILEAGSQEYNPQAGTLMKNIEL